MSVRQGRILGAHFGSVCYTLPKCAQEPANLDKGDKFRMAEIDGGKYLSPVQRQAQASSQASPQTGGGGSALPLLVGLASLLLPGGWMLRIGRAVAAAAVTSVFTSEKD